MPADHPPRTPREGTVLPDGPGPGGRGAPNGAAAAPGVPSPLPGDPVTGEAGRTGSRWWFWIRLGLSVAMLAVLVAAIGDVDLRRAVPRWDARTALWLAVAAALTLTSIVLSALRWQQVLAALGVRLPLRPLVAHYLAGQFVSNVLPTTIGGDVLRVARLARDCGERAVSFASVVLERLTGWLVLPLLTLTALIINPGLAGLGNASRLATGTALVTLAGLAAIVAAGGSRRVAGRFAARDGWRRFLGAVHLGIDRMRRHPRATGGVIAAGVAYQVVLVGAALATAHAIGVRLSPTAALAFIPAVLILQVLPVGISGLGVREGALVLFLTPLGVPAAQAVALGLLLYALNLVVSLAGAPAFALHRTAPVTPVG